MTYALTLVKGNPKYRESTLTLLNKLNQDPSLANDYETSIERVFISFGWPDFIMLLKGPNVELLKMAVVYIRDKASANGDNLETSTIICTTTAELSEKKEALKKKLTESKV
ncbi:MAG TPA: hypothetical protein VE862_10180 [Candidatus Acidoferrum sp.]|nr:hypothetical protein [Candidatus Acidoferrum sp.]